MNLDILEHVREIPTKFHRNLDEKISNSIFYEKNLKFRLKFNIQFGKIVADFFVKF